VSCCFKGFVETGGWTIGLTSPLSNASRRCIPYSSFLRYFDSWERSPAQRWCWVWLLHRNTHDLITAEDELIHLAVSPILARGFDYSELLGSDDAKRRRPRSDYLIDQFLLTDLSFQHHVRVDSEIMLLERALKRDRGVHHIRTRQKMGLREILCLTSYFFQGSTMSKLRISQIDCLSNVFQLSSILMQVNSVL